MKKYFAKYLPVEREKVKLPTFNPEHPNQYSELPVKKLFLCSRDIEWNENAKYWHLKNQHFLTGILGIGEDSKEVHHDKGWSKSEEVIMALGEISPDAIWVKEGDEFDEDEVKESYIITNDKRSSSYNLHWYRIKCPTCKTFH